MQNIKSSLRYWINGPTFDNILTDIYDGKVWKTFKETTDKSLNNFFDLMLLIHISD